MQSLTNTSTIYPIDIANGPSVDAFGRLRASNPLSLFDSKFLFDKQTLFWDEQLTGAGATSTLVTNEASVLLSVPANTVSSVIRQTKRYFNYQPGKSQAVYLTGVFGTGASGITKRMGLFDSNNGLFFQLSGTTFSIVRRTFVTGSPVDNVINQSSWNLDPMDGTGQSGITLDLTKTNIFVIDFQWLGVGRIRFGLDIGGIIVYIHEILNANVLTEVYMSSSNLPIRYSIDNDGSGSASTLKQICSVVLSEGGQEQLGVVRSVSREQSLFSAPNNFLIHPILSIRIKSGYIRGANILPVALTMLTTTTGSNFRWILLMNPTVAGVDAASWVSVPNSPVEYDISRTSANTLTNYTEIATGYVANETSGIDLTPIESTLLLGSSVAGVSDQLVLAYQQVAGGAASIVGSLTWREIV